MHSCIYEEGKEKEACKRGEDRKTSLLAWFALNQETKKFRLDVNLNTACIVIPPQSENDAFAKFSRGFRKLFAKFSQNFRSFREFFEVFGLALTCPDLFGCVRMRSDASGCVRMHSDAFGKIRKNRWTNLVFRNFCEVFEELRKNGRHQQLPRNFLL